MHKWPMRSEKENKREFDAYEQQETYVTVDTIEDRGKAGDGVLQGLLHGGSKEHKAYQWDRAEERRCG